ncbi:MAG: UDP-N-acetylmuramate dehydrogenase [Microbacteriaceae bacterium]|nr:MAG: UDP-N-acetylmuramate dehydrogenase [Microbacteriaceae bacterium]
MRTPATPTPATPTPPPPATPPTPVEPTATVLSELTTIRVGGAPARMVEPTTEAELIETARAVWQDRGHWLLLGGGSNTVASDDGFDGTVIRVITGGIERLDDGSSDRVRLRVQAGEPWDRLVATTVRNGWSGIEALSGIPGSTGAAPVQNIGAYGQELAGSLVAVDFLDEASGRLRRMPAAELELGYRTSVLKRGLAGVVTAVELELTADTTGIGAPLAAPVAYAGLADALGVPLGTRVPVAELRRTVLELRASKGMVLDPDDPDSVSAGSFFTNPIVSAEFAATLPADAPRWPLDADEPDLVAPLDAADADHSVSIFAVAEAAGQRALRQATGPRLVKLSAAWLIEQAGIRRSFALPGSRAAISSKHTLAITNRGGAGAEEIAQLARYVQGRVQSEFGVVLQPEPVLVGLYL